MKLNMIDKYLAIFIPCKDISLEDEDGRWGKDGVHPRHVYDHELDFHFLVEIPAYLH